MPKKSIMPPELAKAIKANKLKMTTEDKAISKLMQIHFLLEDWYNEYMNNIKKPRRTNVAPIKKKIIK